MLFFFLVQACSSLKKNFGLRDEMKLPPTRIISPPTQSAAQPATMKSDFKFSNLLGSVYRQGNLVFSKDGTKLLSPVGNRISVFDLINNKSFTFSYEHRRNIVAFDLNPQNTLLLSVDDRGKAILVNFHMKTVLHHFNIASNNSVRALKYSPDGKLFAVATDRFIQIWRSPSNVDRQFQPFVRYRVYAGHSQDILSITWSHDSRFILSTSKDLTARLWSIDPEEKKIGQMTFAGHRDNVMGAFFNSLQNQIYTVSKDGALFIWEYTAKETDDHDDDEKHYSWRITQKHFFHANQSKVKCVSFQPKTNMLTVGFNTGEFRLYELPDFLQLQQLSMGQNAISGIAVNSTGEWLALGSSKLGQLLVYEWQSESYILKQQGHFDTLNSLTYSPDGSRIVTASEDGKIKVWDVTSGFCLATFSEHTSSVTAVQFAKKGQVLFSSSLDGTVRAWDLIRYRNFRTFTSVERIQFNSLAVDPSGEVVCAGSLDSFDIHVWSVQTGQLLDTLSGHEGPVSCLAFSQENGVLASASWDKTIRIWSIFGRSQQVEPIAVFADVLGLTVRPDGKHVAVSTLKGQITIFDIESGKQVSNIDCRRDVLSGRYLEDRFTAKNSERSKFFTCIHYSFDGMAIVAGGNNNSICLYDVTNEVLLKRFVVSRNMTLNGTQEFLNSNRMTEAGSLDLIDRDGEFSDLEDRVDNSLPGSRRGGDLSTRRIRPEIRVTSIQFSPSANAFAAASTEGLLVYSVDDTLLFDPFDLDTDITPDSLKEALKDKEYLNAFIMSFRLNEEYLINQVYESIPVSQVSLIASELPVVYLARILKFIGDYSIDSPHIEFSLLWIKNLLSSHGSFISSNKSMFSTAVRSIQRFLAKVAKEVVTTSKCNGYTYEFLTFTDGKMDSEQEEIDLADRTLTLAEDENSDVAMSHSDEDEDEGWYSFDKKDNQPASFGEETGSDDDDETLL